MKLPSTIYSLTAITALILAACASPARAPIAANADPQAEVGRVSAAIEDASAKQYDRLSPNNFEQAVKYRNSAAEKLSNGKPAAKVLDDVAVSEEAIQHVKAIGDSNAANMRGVLEARRNALAAQAQKFDNKNFTSADNDLRSVGRDLEKGNYELDAKELSKIEKEFGKSEIAGRKHEELGNVKLQLDHAKANGAKSKVPNLYEMAMSRYDSAMQSIELSPHTSTGYAPAVNDAKAAAQKVEEVLAIAKKNDANESVALTIWNQNQQLVASRNALDQNKTEAAKTLEQTKAEASSKLEQTKAEADAELAKTQKESIAEQEKLAADVEAKNAKIATQTGAIANLKSENKAYASEEELKQKIEELRKTFAPDEAEVVKEGSKIVVRLKKMNFATNRADVNPDAFSTLRKVDNLIAAVPAKSVTVEGHTDAIGSNEKNQALSEKRAESVKKYLVSQGLSQELQIDAQGFGSNRPLTTNKTKAGRATNRRVDIVIDTPTTL
ncbi:MAG: OmpA family protein [Bdellovibrionota bacterium]